MDSIKNLMDRNYLLPWIVNIFLLIFYLFGVQNSPLFASVTYSNVKADPFNGTVLPILMVPDYSKMPSNYKTLSYTQIDSNKMIELPKYDPKVFGKTLSSYDVNSKEYKEILQAQLTYTTPYMSDYNRSYKEYTGSHLAVDVAAPKGTPVRSIANGVVVKAKNQPGGFGQNIVVRHENVNYNGKSINLYSGYAHLSKMYAKEGTKVRKGEIIGEVGNTGATSTGNHLHFQLDVESAPYHPYWPFSMSEAQPLGLNFYSAINYGLGKDKALKYTIHPFNFVYRYESDFDILNSSNLTQVEEEKPVIAVNIEKEEAKKDEEETSILNENYKPTAPEPEVKKDIVLKNLKGLDIEVENNGLASLSGPSEIASVEDFNLDLSSQLTTISIKDTSEKEVKIVSFEESENKEEYVSFTDITKESKYYEALKYLKQNNLIAGYKDGTFKPNNSVSRAEAAKMMVKVSGVGASENTINYFYDVTSTSWERKYVNKLVELSIVDTSSEYFHPQKSLSRVEGLKLVTKISNIDVSKLKGELEKFGDVSNDAWFYPYVFYAKMNALIEFVGDKFMPNQKLTRGELAYMIYKIKTK